MKQLKVWLSTAALCLSVDLLLSAMVVPPEFAGWRAVTVEPGQTLWTLGEKYCPSADPRDVVDAIEHRNHITGSLYPGEIVWVPTKAESVWAKVGL
ncbi:MAG: LysM domain-containing protein [Alicyclobacillus sp.]|nr:LysM domain-containing protein [Alicyclobacillus sp.]